MSSVVISGNTSGAVTLTVPDVSGTNTVTLPAATGTVMVSGNMPAFSVNLSGTQVISTGTWTKISFNTEVFDTNNCFDSVTNYRFTPTVAGYYQVSIQGRDASGITTSALQIAIYKNGTSFAENIGAVSGNGLSSGVSCLIYMNGSTDYIEGYVRQGSGGNMNLSAATNLTFFTGSLVRGA